MDHAGYDLSTAATVLVRGQAASRFAMPSALPNAPPSEVTYEPTWLRRPNGNVGVSSNVIRPRDFCVDPVVDGRAFIERAIEHRTFCETGVIRGRSRAYAWVVVDPVRHPLHIWRSRGNGLGAYARTARELDAAVFTNGPMTGKRFASGDKVTRSRALLAVGSHAATAAACTRALVRNSRLAFPAAAGVLAAAWAAQDVLDGWAPCGHVVGAKHQVRDLRDFDGEGRAHAWFGRVGVDYESYRVASGHPPARLVEGCGGLLLLVRDFAVACFDTTFIAYPLKRGVAAWALVDVPPRICGVSASKPLSGVLLVIASRSLTAAGAAHVLVSAGARDAVATDQRASILLGAKATCTVGPPPWHRQAFQEYGLYCA